MVQSKYSVIIGLIFSLCFLCGCIIETQDSNGTEIPDGLYVSSSGEKEFTSIQDAIDQASENKTVYVFPGIYYEEIKINKSINLMGHNPETTIIDGYKNDDVIRIIDTEFCNITGFTIQNSSSTGSGVELNSANNNISNNIIQNNDKGIYCISKTHNSFYNNTFLLNDQYGIYILNSNDNLVKLNTFTQNHYGMRIKGSRDNNVIHNVFLNNDYGLYFCCGATSNTIFYNTFINNSNWNANDGVGGNTWHNEKNFKGNYWDDYTGLDEDNNGIGDTSYIITSYQSRKDNYPLMEPWP
jgi:parallel beta-helix repeat protein